MTKTDQVNIGKLITKKGFTKEEAADIIKKVGIMKTEFPTYEIANILNIDEATVVAIMGM